MLKSITFNTKFYSSSNVHTTTTPCDVYRQSKSAPISSQSSLNLNLINQQQQQQFAQYIDGSIIPTVTTAGIPLVSSTSSLYSSSMPMNQHSQIVFNSNNPFLNDNFDAITNDVGAFDGNKLNNFFNIDDSNDTELLFAPDDEIMISSSSTVIYSQKTTPAAKTTSPTSTTMLTNENSYDENSHEEAQLLKNKREKFSNASPTMKICLVVSPPTNKIFQVSVKTREHKIGTKWYE